MTFFPNFDLRSNVLVNRMLTIYSCHFFGNRVSSFIAPQFLLLLRRYDLFRLCHWFFELFIAPISSYNGGQAKNELDEFLLVFYTPHWFSGCKS